MFREVNIVSFLWIRSNFQHYKTIDENNYIYLEVIAVLFVATLILTDTYA
jgi:hypothetical protein